MTGTLAEVARAAALLLAAVFAWAGVAKLRSRRTTARTFRAFGLRAPEALAVGVPVVEVALAVGLVLAPAEAALVALAVLAAFTAVLVRALRAGVDVGCGCFGTARRGPVSAVELVRNGFLAAGAVVATAAPGPGLPPAWAVAVALAAAAVAAAVLAALDRGRRPTPRFAGGGRPAVGEPAPEVDGVAGRGRATVLAFVGPSCVACAPLRRAVEVLAAADPSVAATVVELGDATRDAFDAFGVRTTPYVVVVDAAGLVAARGAARDGDELAELLGRARGGSATAP